MPPDERDQQASRATKLALMGIFMGSLAAFSAWTRDRGEHVKVGPFDLAILGLSAYRVGHLLAYERVAAPLREPVTETIPDASGVGETVVARGSGARAAIGELLSCPVCIGTWVAAGLVYGLHLAPRPTRVFLAVMSTTGVADITNNSIEALTWIARAARKQAAK